MNFMERQTGMTQDERRHVVSELLNNVQERIMFGSIEAWKVGQHVYMQKPDGSVSAVMTNDPDWLLNLLENKARFNAGRDA